MDWGIRFLNLISDDYVRSTQEHDHVKFYKEKHYKSKITNHKNYKNINKDI